jgi:PiT family inorganic phosphate transporter
VGAQADGFNIILAALVGAIAFDLGTWYLGLPTSSSHALAGGLVGAALAYKGPAMLVGSGITKIALFIVLSPLIGLVLAVVLMNVVLFIGKVATSSGRVPTSKTNGVFRRLQLASAAAYSLGHGANDAQKTMGIIAAVIAIDRSAGAFTAEQFKVTLPIVLAAHSAIALGTLAGGWRIVHTLGSKITKLQPMGGFSAETAAATTLFTTAHFGIPVSTTHTITGAVVGVGATRRFSAVRWGLTGRVIYAWILTFPGAAIIAAAMYALLTVVPASFIGPVGLAAAASWALLFLRRRQRERAAVFAPPA